MRFLAQCNIIHEKLLSLFLPGRRVCIILPETDGVMASNRLKADASHSGQNVDLRDRKLQESDPPASGNAQDDETYLAELGARVRRIRAIRGMSRKVLAQSSGISERYIAQMEAGAAYPA